jgi:hypothetical protein
MSSERPGLEGGHILVDFDRTLAQYEPGEYEPGKLGAPVPVMVERVKRWLAEGRDVRIFTARAWFDRIALVTKQGNRKVVDRAYAVLKDCKAMDLWCQLHIGRKLPITFEKTPKTDIIFDDRAYHVAPNTGSILPILPPLG